MANVMACTCSCGCKYPLSHLCEIHPCGYQPFRFSDSDLSHRRYRFSADVYDTSEMIPWIRTFICRITDLHFSNRTLENQFKSDIEKMYRMYCIEEVDV